MLGSHKRCDIATLDVFALGHPSSCRFGCFMMCCRMRILRTKHSRRIEKTIAVSFWTYRLLCPLIVFLAFTKEVIAGWNLEATEATEARVLLVVHVVMETWSLKNFGSSFAQLCRQSSSITTSVPLSSKGLLRPCAMQICFVGSPLWPKACKTHGKLVLLLLPVLTRFLPKFPRFRFDLLDAMSWYSYTFLRNLWRAIYTRDAQRDSQDWKLRRNLVCLALSQRVPQNGWSP